MDPLKSAWDNTPTPTRTTAEIQSIASKQASPVMRGIRKQLIIETLGYTAFLVVYYDFFDGNKKPFYLNVLLVAAIIFIVLYNLTGYWLAKNPATGQHLLEQLQRQAQQLKRYAVIAVSSRLLALGCIFAFFLAPIHWDNNKSIAMAAIVVLMGVQFFFLRKIWAGRIQRLNETIISLQNA
ncbi:MAG: hypothetical protein J7623_12435 [Chitinophaga sp.]|uniref:hypothetical protein n=1 Tax=Chitinophaga sp. TaxID=1869181 RepID=UPI001B113DF5|nr:hypothetical protein [Chitinophaga sp.]MBO9729435.1 hypothetical protein [Chitinophaga sp.]